MSQDSKAQSLYMLCFGFDKSGGFVFARLQSALNQDSKHKNSTRTGSSPLFF